MEDIVKEMEVYNYVKHHSIRYFDTILRALTDGVKEENNIIKEKKSKVEGGLVSLFSAFPINNFKKLKPNMKSVLKDALLNCTFFSFEKEIDSLND